MHLYRFFNPSANVADKCVIIISATNVDAINAYVSHYYPDCYGVNLSKDFNRQGVIIMEASAEPLFDGVVIFSKIFAIDIN